MPPGDGFRIPIILDFSESLKNVTQFKAAVSQHLAGLARSGATVEAGATPRQVTGSLAQTAGAARAAILGAGVTGSTAAQTEHQRKLLKGLDETIREQARLLEVRAPSEKEVARSQRAAFRASEEASAKAVARRARAEQQSAKAAEKEAALAERRAQRAAQTARATGDTAPLRTSPAELARRLQEQTLARRAEVRAVTGTTLDAPLAAERLAAERERVRISALAAGLKTPDIHGELGKQKAAINAATAQTKTATSNETRSNADLLLAKARLAAARKLEERAANRLAQQELNASLSPAERGTRLQRIQAGIAARDGGSPRLPTEFLTGGQLLKSRALTTASFAASGALLYGSLRFAKELVSEATDLQVELGIVKSQLENVGDAGGRSFSQIREEIIGVSHATGVMANRVAHVARQLAGAFSDETGRPDFGRGLTEAQAGLELGRITNIPEQEITDSLTAISLAFAKTTKDGKSLPFEDIGDQLIGLSQRFGVTEADIVRFTGDLAPLGAELGFTITQLSALGAVAQQTSGRTGTVLAEQFGRILPALADRSADLLLLFQENEKTASQIPTLSRALASRDLPAVLVELVKGYENFTAAQQNTLVSLVGSRREAGSFYALLTNGQKTISALESDPSDFAGAQAKRFEDFSKTVQFSFEKAQRAIEEFGIMLFNAGLADALVATGRALEFVAASASFFLGIVGELNEATDGWAGKLGGVVLALFLLNKTLTLTANAYKAVAASQTLATLTAGGKAAAAVPFGFGLRQAAPAAATGFASRLAIGSGQNLLPGRAGGLIASNAAGLTLLAGTIAFTIREQGKKDLAEGVDFLRSQTRDALERGIDPATIRAQAKTGQDSLGTFDRINLFVHGQPDISESVNEEIRLFEFELRKSQLEFIKKYQERRLKEEEAKPSGGADIPNYSRTADQSTDAEQLDRLLALYEQDPQHVGGAVEELIASQTDPDVVKRLRALDKAFRADKKVAAGKLAEFNSAVDRLADDSIAAGTDELRLQVAAGEAGSQKLIARLRLDIAALKVTIEGLREAARAANGEDRVEIFKQLQGFLDQLAALEDEIEKLSDIQAAPDLRIRIRNALKLPGADQANLGDVQGIIADLEGLDPDEQLERVFQGIDLLAKIAEAAGKTSYELPPEFQKVLAQAQARDLSQSDKGQELADALGIGIAELGTHLVDAILAVGNDANKIGAAVIVARRDMLQRALVAALTSGTLRSALSLPRIFSQLSELDSLQSEVTSLVKGFTVPTGGTGFVATKEPVDPNILAKAIAEGRLAIRRAQANGDPVQIAQLAIEAADIQARFAKDEGERLQAMAARIEAFSQLRDAEADIPQALRELAQAQSANNAVKTTGYAADAAGAAVTLAKGTAARLRAEAAKTNADRAARDAVRDVFTAQQELLIAIANAAGDTVAAAQGALVIARKNLQNLIAEGGGQTETDRARAEVVAAQAAVRDAQFQDQFGDIDFLLEMERISVQQAIQMLERLAQIPGATEEMIRSIERRIKQLRDGVNSDLAFNISDIRLPTLYEVRRLMQSGDPQGTGGYQDNRIVTMGNIIISTEVDAQAFLADLAEIVGAPPTSGTYVGIY